MRIKPAFSFFTFQAILLFLAGVAFVIFLSQVKIMLPVRGDNVYPEASGIVSAERLIQGLPLYSDFRQPPYVLSTFPPLWFYCLKAAAKLGVSTPDGLTLFGRVLTLFFLAAIAVTGFIWNRAQGYAVGLALLGPALFLAFPALLPWAVAARPDFPAFFFSFLAVVLCSLRRERSFLVLAAIAAALSFLFKHSCVSAPTAICLMLLSFRKWKETILFSAVWGVIVFPILWRFNATSNGNLFTNLSGMNFGAHRFANAHEILTHLLTRSGYGFAPLLLAFALVGLVEVFHNPTASHRLLGFYFFVTIGLAILGTSLAGAGENHYLEPGIAWAALVPLAALWLKENWVKGSAVETLICILLVVWLVPTLDLRHWQVQDLRTEDYRKLVPMVASEEVLTDIPYLAARSKTLELLDAVSLHYAEDVGSWSPQPLIDSVRGRKFDAVILNLPVDKPELEAERYPRIGDPLRRAIRDNYGFCFQSHSAHIYGPLRATPSGTNAVCQPAP